MLVKTWRWTSVEQGNISCIAQALCTIYPRRGCFLCALPPVYRGRYSLEFHVMVNLIMSSTWLGQRVLRCLVNHYFGCVCEGAEINIWIGRLRKAACPPHVVALTNQPKTWTAQKCKCLLPDCLELGYQLKGVGSPAFGLKQKHWLFLCLKVVGIWTGTTA